MYTLETLNPQEVTEVIPVLGHEEGVGACCAVYFRRQQGINRTYIPSAYFLISATDFLERFGLKWKGSDHQVELS